MISKFGLVSAESSVSSRPNKEALALQKWLAWRNTSKPVVTWMM